VDKRNYTKIWPLLRLFKKKGWLSEENQFYPYLSRVAPFTEVCSSSVSEIFCPSEIFHKTNFRWMKKLLEEGLPVVCHGLYGFPGPKSYNCGAVGKNGFIITPGGEVFKCGLQINEKQYAIGKIGESLSLDHPNAKRWGDYSPFDAEECANCKYLPTCLGGCPRNRVEKRNALIKENCKYYKKYEIEILKFHLLNLKDSSLIK
jgi:uncharacterized protein